MLKLWKSFYCGVKAGVRSKTVLSWSVLSVVCLALTMMSPSESSAQSVQPSFPGFLAIQPEGVTVRYPAAWSAGTMGNVHTLTNTGQIMIFTERRTDHAEAVRRLKEIEAEATSPSSFLNIGSWPALQRRHLAPKPLPGQDAPASPGNPEMVLQITTAVAAGDLLVRLESFLPQDAPSQVADEVEAIGRSLNFATAGDPAQVGPEIEDLRGSPRLGFPAFQQEIQDLRGSPILHFSALPSDSQSSGFSVASDASLLDSTGVADSSAGASVRVTNQGGRDSEIEVAVSSNGRNIVIGTNRNYHFSTNGGQTWNQSVGINGNDPSVGWGQSGGANGTFYAANIAAPSTAISVSTDSGANFAFRANAFTCQGGPPPSCGGFNFPDQEHIAVDRFNITAQGDQVYSAWRQGGGSWGIVCSIDNGNTWTTAANAVFTGGDFPRITVGQDGFVYVVFLAGNSVMLSKFNSCETNQNPMAKAIGDQAVANGINHVGCPTPGLDRCNFRNTLASPTVAVDDTNANHVYVAYAVNTNPGGAGGFPNITNQNTANERIILQDSLNGGLTWNAADPNRTVTVSAGVTARRFMPWVCAVGGAAHVTWYDRRAASPGGTTVSNNSLTDLFGASAFLNGNGNLTPGTELKINDPGTTDAQCEAGAPTGSTASWPSPVDNQNDSESCSVQPQIGGLCCIAGEIDGSNRCLNPTAASGQQRCDFSAACPNSLGVAQQCAAQRGSPKYGDYNGSACAAGRFYMAWASATAPASIAASTTIDAFFSVALVSGPQIQIPGNVALGDTCVGSTNTASLDVCNTGFNNLNVSSISSSNAQFAVTTPTSNFPVGISPDFCFPFQARFTPASTGPKTSTLTIASDDPLNPSVNVQATGNGTQQHIAVTGSTDFGDICAGPQAEKTIRVCNNGTGTCDLIVSSVAFSPACADFSLVNNPFPSSVSHDSCLDVTVRFTPTSVGPKSCTLVITSNDPLAPTVSKTVTANTPEPSIDVPLSLTFLPNVIQTAGVCTAANPLPINNKGTCDLKITAVTIGGTNGSNFSLSGLPSLTNPVQPGHTLGDGALTAVFAPTAIDRDRLGTLTVTYVSDPITGATATANGTPSTSLCGEGGLTGARVLVREGGVPLATVEKIQLQRINANRNKNQLDTNDVAQNLPLTTVTPAAVCAPFQFHREYGTVSNPIQLLPGSYQVTAAAILSDGKRHSKTVGFDVDTCNFNPQVIIDF